MNKNLKVAGISGLSLVFVVLSFIFGKYDLEISNLIANPASPFGLKMEVLGEMVAPYLFSLAGIVFLVYYKSKTFMAKLPYMLFIVIGIGYNITLLRKVDWIYGAILIFVFLTGFVLTYRFLANKAQDELRFYAHIALVAILWFVSILVCINLIKIFWGRVRFRDLTDLSQFTPFYLPQGINGNRSFPSGHTSNAACLFIMTMFSPITKKKFIKFLLYIIPIIWIIVMAASRVMVGAHYCSDVLYGMTISLLLYYFVKKYADKKMAAIK